ncbi:MAG TPA: hypothetical protein VH500_04255 [Nitrososphaeraceae archaeon]|jgi:response regulator RpfG family c-di-GMP phosphodiesterase
MSLEDEKWERAFSFSPPLQSGCGFCQCDITPDSMPDMNGFELCEKILELDVNIGVCFMSALEVNIQSLREVYPNVNLGCYIEKPVTIKDLVKGLSEELD